jgi:hypothetical protein
MLFMSVDLVGSTAYKQSPAAENESKQSEGRLRPFFTFLAEFAEQMNEQRRLVANELNCNLPPEPSIWKILGDELIFVTELKHGRDAQFHLRALKRTAEYRNKQEIFPMKVKASAWLAGFPVVNGLLPLEGHDEYDYLGAAIDTGFRLSKFSSPRRMCISVDLAYHLIDAEPGFFEYGYEGRRDLKGMMEQTGYPVIWVDVGHSAHEKSEAKLMGKQKCDPHELKQFCTDFITEVGMPKYLPFIFGENTPPPGYDEEVQKTRAFLLKFFSIVDDGPSGPSIADAKAREIIKDLLSLAREAKGG